jgi:PAS domain S-box-containing protein
MESKILKRPPPPSFFNPQNKFLLSLALILFFFSVSLSLFIYLYQRNILEDEAYSKTELVMTAVASTRSYVRETLRPKMYEVLGEDAFILEAMSSSYVSRAIMDRLQEKSPDFKYRRVSKGARNPEFEANLQELEMIQYFSEHPLEESWQGIKTGEGGRYYIRYSPIIFNKNCFRCHGEPDDAPPFIREKYGSEAGFFKQNNKGVEGVVSIAIPVESGLKSIKEVTYFVFGMVLFSILMLYASISFFFNRLVVQNIRGVLDIFWSNLADDEGRQLYEKTQRMDEVEELKAGAEIIADHLHAVRQQIHDYATNLEKKVEEQTRALRKSATALEKKVDQRNEELRTLNSIAELLIQSARTKEILSSVLQQALKVIPAKGAGIYLYTEPAGLLELKCQEYANELIEEIPCAFSSICKGIEQLKGDELLQRCEEAFVHTNFIKDNVQLSYLNVPLICRDHALGVMTLTGLDSSQITTELRELLLSVGRQLGIMLENIENTVKLIRSKELLQSVFDGITDFVVLLGRQGEVVRMINESLRKKYDLKEEQILGRSVDELAQYYSPFQLFEKIRRVPINEPASDLVTLTDGATYEVFFYPVFNDQGILENVVCSAKDVTHKKQIEQKIHQTEKLAAIGQLATPAC